MTDDTPNPATLDLAELLPDDGRPDTLAFRNITATPADPVTEWGSEGLRAAVDRGAAVHWRRIAETILDDPFGPVAEILETNTMWTSEFFGRNAPVAPDTFHVLGALLSVIDLARAGVTVPGLTPDMTGVWVVYTVGTTHIWDLDDMTYERRPGPASRGGKLLHDGAPQRITRVDIWPRTRSYFKVWYDDPTDPTHVEQFRQSSLIRMIVPHTTDDTNPT